MITRPDPVQHWGTYHQDGSSLWDYLYQQTSHRNLWVSVLRTSGAGQDQRVIDDFKAVRSRGYCSWCWNGRTCTTAISEPLHNIINNDIEITRFPIPLSYDVALSSSNISGGEIEFLQGSQNGGTFFNKWVGLSEFEGW